MIFEIQHLFFEKDKIVCDENNFPKWMKSKDMQWWIRDCVLKLEVNKSIESDFHKITRIK